MSDTTGILGVTSLNGRTDAISMLSNAATRMGAGGNMQTGAMRNSDNRDFGAALDATAMSVLASAQVAPQVQAGMITPPMVTETRSYHTVEITTSTTSTRGNNYAKATAMTETGQVEETNDTPGAESSFNGKLDAALSDAGNQMQEEAAERLQVSEEQVTFAMGQAELTPVDLLTEDGLSKLVTEVTGQENLSLLTDENLYSNLQALLETAENLKEDIAQTFQITMEGVEDAIAITTAQMVETVDATETDAGSTFSFARHEGDENLLLQAADRRFTRDAEQESDAVIMEKGASRPQTQQMPAASANDETSGNGTGQPQAGVKSQPVVEDHSAAQGTLQTVQTFAEAVNEALSATGSVYGSGAPITSEAEHILQQVIEQMRTSISDGMTEINMQLHPQSLGRVHVQLQAMEGGEMVAKFTAQSEDVRAALANQMPQLLQRFEEQGMKVGEVQVALAEQGFQESKDNEMRREEQRNQQQDGIARTGRMRRIQMDLADMSAEDMENLDEDLRIEAEMMAAEGNTVSYRA